MSLHFDSWVYLLGAASALVPLLLHLSHVQHKKHMRFSTTRFFTEAIRRAQRRLRIKQWLLLLLRMAVCFFLAAALAGPFLRSTGSSILKQRRDVVLLLDDSASMAYKENDRTSFQRARDAAEQAVRGLQPGDRVGLALTSEPDAAGLVALSDDHQSVLDRIRSTKVTQTACDMRAGYERAVRSFNVSDTAGREIYFFTDRQKAALATPAWVDAGGPMHLFVVNCAAAEPANLAVVGLEAGAGTPMTGVPVEIKVRVRNSGRRLQSAKLTLLEQSESGTWEPIAGPMPVAVRSAFTQTVPVTYQFDEGKRIRLRAQLSEDNLALDNVHHALLEVADEVPVMVVDGDPNPARHRSESFFLEAALKAFNSAGKAAALKPEVFRVEQIGNRPFRGYRCVILANVGNLTPGVHRRLKEYVQSGGSLLVFLGDRIDREWYNMPPAAAEGDELPALLPGALKDILGDPRSRREVLSIVMLETSHPALSIFADPTAANPGKPKFFAAYDLEPGSATVLAELTGGRPLLVERTYGQGRVVIFTSSCDEGWTNLPRRAFYVPLLHQLVSYLAAQQVIDPDMTDPAYSVGDVVKLGTGSWDRARPITVVAPDKTTYELTAPADGTGEPGRLAPAVFDHTGQPGIYAALVPQIDEEPIRVEFAVNPPAAESEMTPVDDEEIRDLLGLGEQTQLTVVGQPDELSEAIQRAPSESRFWPIVLMAVLVLALIEPFLANFLTVLGAPPKPRQTEAEASAPAPGSAAPQATRVTR